MSVSPVWPVFTSTEQATESSERPAGRTSTGSCGPVAVAVGHSGDAANSGSVIPWSLSRQSIARWQAELGENDHQDRKGQGVPATIMQRYRSADRASETPTSPRLGKSPDWGVVICSVYGIAHLAWWLAGAPEFVRKEFFAGPVAVGAAPALLAAGGSVLSTRLGVDGRRALRWAALAVTWLGCVGLAAYCLGLWPGLAMLLTVPFGVPMTGNDVAALILRFVGTAGALLVARAAVKELRQIRGVCADCGRSHASLTEERRRRVRLWAVVGGYFALTSFAVRMVLVVPDWIKAGGVGGPNGFALFVILMSAGGTVLPLALTHRWGRVWPWWTGRLAGRRVPRWLVLWPGVMMSIGLGVYFGIGGIAAYFIGLTDGLVEILAYTGWGLGLAVATSSYATLTRPPCRQSSASLRAVESRPDGLLHRHVGPSTDRATRESKGPAC